MFVEKLGVSQDSYKIQVFLECDTTMLKSSSMFLQSF